MAKVSMVCAMAVVIFLSGQVVADAAASGISVSRAKLTRAGDRTSVYDPSTDGDRSNTELMWVLAATGVAVVFGLAGGSGGSKSETPKSP